MSQLINDHSRLAKFPLFKGVSAASLEQINKRCAWRHYSAGEPIVSYLDTTNDVYFLAEGQALVRIYSMQGKAVSFCEMGPGEAFGEYAAIDPGQRSASIEARTVCLVGSMTAATFLKVLASEPTVTMTLLRQCVAKVRSLTTRVYEFSTLAVSNRIQAELLRLSRLSADGGTLAILNPSPTHADIASRTSTHREAVTREINKLARAGIIQRRGKTLVIVSIDRLNKLVQEATGE